MNPKRPQTGGSYATTPMAAALMTHLGPGLQSGSVTLSRDETRALNKLYGFKPEKPRARPPKPERQPDPEGTPEYKRCEADGQHKRAVEAWEKWEDPSPFYQAGADRNMLRHAERDGLRLIAWLAKHVPEGTDPLKTLIGLAVDVGWEVNPLDVAFAEDVHEDADLEDEEPVEAPPSTPRRKGRGSGKPSGAGA